MWECGDVGGVETWGWEVGGVEGIRRCGYISKGLCG